MGKASKNKGASSTEEEGLKLSSYMVLHQNVVPTYNFSRMVKLPMVSNLIDQGLSIVAPDEWAIGMKEAFKRKEFRSLVSRIIDIGHAEFWKTSPKEALMFGNNKELPDSAPLLIAYTKAHRHLCGNNESPRWISLVMCAFSRMIAVNSSMGFDSNEWTEFTLSWFDLEKLFLQGNGKRFASKLVSVDREYFEGKMSELNGSRLPHALAEMTINAPDTSFFTEL